MGGGESAREDAEKRAKARSVSSISSSSYEKVTSFRFFPACSRKVRKS